MISDKYKCFFVRIPSTSGTWIQLFLGWITPKIEIDVHQDMAYYKKNYPEKWKQYFKFTFVRNPWDRIVDSWSMEYPSNGKFWDTNTSINKEQFDNITKKEFNRFVKEELRITKDDHYFPQIIWLKNIDEYDFIGKFEHRKEDIKFIENKLNILDYSSIETPWGKLTDSNKIGNSRRLKDYRVYYDEESIKIVEEFENKVIQIFNYKF